MSECELKCCIFQVNITSLQTSGSPEGTLLTVTQWVRVIGELWHTSAPYLGEPFSSHSPFLRELLFYKHFPTSPASILVYFPILFKLKLTRCFPVLSWCPSSYFVVGFITFHWVFHLPSSVWLHNAQEHNSHTYLSQYLLYFLIFHVHLSTLNERVTSEISFKSPSEFLSHLNQYICDYNIYFDMCVIHQALIILCKIFSLVSLSSYYPVLLLKKS